MKKVIFALVSSVIFLGACTSQTDNNTQPSNGNTNPSPVASANLGSGNTPTGGTVKFVQVKEIIDQRCATCHSANSADKSYGNMAGGVSYDTAELIKAKAQRIKVRAVVAKDMPKENNKTNITQEERDLLGKWVDEGANIN